MFPQSASALGKLQSSYKSLSDVRAAFRKCDSDGDGHISVGELRTMMSGFSGADVDAVFAMADKDQSGGIDFNEFIAMMIPNSGSILKKISSNFSNVQQVMDAFKKIDANGDGALSQQELVNGMKAAGMNFNAAEVKAIFALADINQDGEINFVEFVSALFPAAADGCAKLRNALKNLNSVKDAFKKLDVDRDGEISFQEFKNGMSAIVRLSDGELRSVFSMGDVDGDGQVSFSEFARMIIPSVDEKVCQLKKMLGSASAVEAAFKKFDVNKDGKISTQELNSGLKGSGMKFSDEEVNTIFAVADLDGDGEISLAEFEHLLGTAPSFGRIEDVKAAFYRFDANNDGSIDKNELKKMLAATGKNPSDQEVNSMFQKADIDGDGKIDLQEFIRLMFPMSSQTLSKLQKSFKNISDVKSAFRKYDTDGDGHISRIELRQVMAKFSEEEVDAVFCLGDMDQSGCIDYQEFVLMMLATASGTLKKMSSQFRFISDVKSAFKRIDINQDGQISRDELKNGLKIGNDEVEVVFAVGDLDGDGEIDVGEFIRIMFPSAASALARFRNSFSCIEDVISAFRSMDMNSDGALTKQELLQGMNSFGKQFTDDEVSSVFAMADVNSDGEINYSEFVSMMFPAASTALAKFRRNHSSLKNAKATFDSYDIDGDEEISHDELVSGMGGEYTANEINAIFAMGDTDQDGKITFLEFAKIMMPAANDALSKFWKCFNNVSSVRQAFQKLDIDKDGQISKQEVMQGMASAGLKLSSAEVDTLFILGDKDSNGQIDFSEFAQIMIPSANERIAKLKKCFRNRSEIEAAFRRFDANKDGAISFDELRAGLSCSGIHFNDQEVETCFAVADRDCDGEVSLTEFVSMLSSCHTSGGAVEKFYEFCVGVAFNFIDANKDGAISFQELSSSLRQSNFTDQEIQTIFALADHDKDGEVSLNELLRALRK